MNDVYRAVDYKPGYNANQNPHNQFLSALVSTGIIGLVTLLVSLSYQLRIAWREHRILLIVSLMLLLVNFFF
ncbi:MAG: hypothetical protein HC859_12880 [Bacteroidia bacterium]|nr:hypothetical protein [Bacteroidia bacterium]